MRDVVWRGYHWATSCWEWKNWQSPYQNSYFCQKNLLTRNLFMENTIFKFVNRYFGNKKYIWFLDSKPPMQYGLQRCTWMWFYLQRLQCPYPKCWFSPKLQKWMGLNENWNPQQLFGFKKFGAFKSSIQNHEEWNISYNTWSCV